MKFESTFGKKTDKVLTIKLSNGGKIECTKNHKFFTTEGWVRASELENKRIICKKDVPSMQKILCPKDVPDRHSKRKNVHRARMLFTILCKEIKESNAQLRNKAKNGCHPKKDRTQASSKRWEWKRWITHRKFSSQLFRNETEWLAQRISCQNLCRAQEWSLSKLLQNRCSKSRIVNWIRVGWFNTLWEEKSKRQKEKRLFGTIRVVNISHKKQEGTRDVYDLQISGHPSYYANDCLVHNCHTIPHHKEGRYNKFFKQITKPVIGFTATPYRLGYGYLHLGEYKFFDDIVYTIPIKRLQDEGYLCRLTCKGTKKRLNPEGIKKQAGDFMIKKLSMAFDREKITEDIISELLIYKKLRKKWLLFAIDIKHAEHITDQLLQNGIRAGVVHSKMTGNRDAIISGFKEGKYQCLVSVAVLTTGFDAPDVDLIGLLRPTSSPVLHVQIIGRGLRTSDGKDDCLVLDFAGNLMRNGPIDAPIIKIKGKGGGEPIMKECNNCYEIVHAAVRVCPCCKTEFQFRHKLSTKSANRELLSLEEWYDVEDVKYSRYVGSKGTPMLKVSYVCGIRRFNEFICLQHNGYAKHKAHHWWKRRCDKYNPPLTAQEGLEKSSFLSQPNKILVEESGKYPNIKEMVF
jgi:DNA repair protein RadD